MSRFHGEWDGEGPPPEFWDQAVQNAINGRRGQAVLRELKEALLALPSSRLIEGSITRAGEVCALGALAAGRLAQGPVTLHNYGHFGDTQVVSLADLETLLDDDGSTEYGTVELGEAMGLRRAMAWAISWQNDEGTWEKETPEARFRRVLAWIESRTLPLEMAESHHADRGKR